MDIDPNQLLGLISEEKGKEEKNHFLIVDDPAQEDDGIYCMLYPAHDMRAQYSIVIPIDK